MHRGFDLGQAIEDEERAIDGPSVEIRVGNQRPDVAIVHMRMVVVVVVIVGMVRMAIAVGLFALWFALDPDPAAIWREFVIGDFNRDQLPDLAVTTSNPWQVVIYRGTTGGQFAVVDKLAAERFARVISANFNRDPLPDLAIINEFRVSAFLNGGNGFLPITLPGLPFNTSAGVAEDFNLDGITDLAFCSRERAAWSASGPITGGGARWRTGPLEDRGVPWNWAGRKPGPQLFEPACGTPRGSGMATNAGRSRFSLPRAYVTQAPRLGNPSSTDPVERKFSAGPWVLDLAVIEWMKLMSSARPARLGSKSLIILPHSPRG